MGQDQDVAATIRELAAPLVAAAGLDLEETVVRGARGSRLVRLVVDSDDGVDVETCARLSNAVSDLLDEHDLIDGSYTLQVSSPGADRPLRTARDFRRNIGRPVRIAHAERGREQPPTGEIIGVVVGADDAAVKLEVDGDVVDLPLTEVAHGKIVLPW